MFTATHSSEVCEADRTPFQGPDVSAELEAALSGVITTACWDQEDVNDSSRRKYFVSEPAGIKCLSVSDAVADGGHGIDRGTAQ